MSELTYYHSMKKRGKPLVWLHGEVKSPPFSFEARIDAGVLLRRLQQGDTIGLPHSRPMPSIGRACHELRIHDENKTWRIVYCLAAEAVVVLEVFAKTTNQTPQSVIDICKDRLKQYRTI